MLLIMDLFHVWSFLVTWQKKGFKKVQFFKGENNGYLKVI